MRPLKLKMRAFGAYINLVELNFEENLLGRRLFLINGDTGAGKTTILDAICFALYGTASGEDRKGNMMRSKGISDKIKTEVEFTFALGEKIYTIYRALTVKLEKGERKFIQSVKLTHDGEIIDNKKTTVDNKIKELLGFNVEQFRQVVVLPQGAFRTFLFAKADERQKVLNAIFNAEFYKRVEDALKSKSEAAQREFDDLQREKKFLETQLQGSKTDTVTLEKLRSEFIAAQAKTIALQKTFDAAQAELTAGEKLSAEFVELERRKKSLETAEKNLVEAERILSNAKIEYDLRENEQSKREELKSKVNGLTKIKELLLELEDKRKALAEAEKNLQSATDELKDLEAHAKKCEVLLAKLKSRRNELSGAEKRFVEAQTTFKRATDRKKVLNEIAELEHKARSMRQQVSSAEKLLNEADIEQKRLEKLQRDGSAARLAKNLRDGEPCPVCGSKIHYSVDFSDALVPSDKEIDDVKAEVERCKKILDGKKNSASSIEGQLISKREELKKFSDMPADDEEIKKLFDAAKKDVEEFKECEERIAKGEVCVEGNKSSLEYAREKKISASNEREKIFGAVQTLQAQIDEKYLSNSQKLNADLAEMGKILHKLETAWKQADKAFREAGNKKSAFDGAKESARASWSELSDKLKDKNPPELDKLRSTASDAQINYLKAVKVETSIKNSLDNLEKISAQIFELDKKINAAEKTLRIWKKLSDVASGSIPGRKISFTRYYLRAMFEEVLIEANYRLEKMSDRRYWFKPKDKGKVENSTAGLNLEILDEYTGETRPVETLSGGESFLASLSLALGLAAVVRNNAGGIKLDTIFIDEGFGSLDSEKLDFAISTITELSGGRLVGIISHIEELKNQIPVRLEVTKTKTGSTAKFIS